MDNPYLPFRSDYDVTRIPPNLRRYFAEALRDLANRIEAADSSGNWQTVSGSSLPLVSSRNFEIASGPMANHNKPQALRNSPSPRNSPIFQLSPLPLEDYPEPPQVLSSSPSGSERRSKQAQTHRNTVLVQLTLGLHIRTPNRNTAMRWAREDLVEPWSSWPVTATQLPCSIHQDDGGENTIPEESEQAESRSLIEWSDSMQDMLSTLALLHAGSSPLSSAVNTTPSSRSGWITTPDRSPASSMPRLRVSQSNIVSEAIATDRSLPVNNIPPLALPAAILPYINTEQKQNSSNHQLDWFTPAPEQPDEYSDTSPPASPGSLGFVRSSLEISRCKKVNHSAHSGSWSSSKVTPRIKLYGLERKAITKGSDVVLPMTGADHPEQSGDGQRKPLRPLKRLLTMFKPQHGRKKEKVQTAKDTPHENITSVVRFASKSAKKEAHQSETDC